MHLFCTATSDTAVPGVRRIDCLENFYIKSPVSLISFSLSVLYSLCNTAALLPVHAPKAVPVRMCSPCA